MYSIKIKPEQLTDLWKLREFAGQGSIAGQINRAINAYIQQQTAELIEIEKIGNRYDEEE